MGIQRVGSIERGLRRIFVPTFVLSGAVVVSGFFFPDYVGEVISGRWWLVIALLFFGTGLGYLAVLPTEEDEITEGYDPAYLLRVRRAGARENLRRFLSSHDPVTFGVPVLALVAFFVLQWTVEAQLLSAVEAIESLLMNELGWIFVGVMLLSVIVCAVLLLGRWGEIRLGGPDAEPSYTYPVYFTMFFTAGIAAGIVFWGAAEPLLHVANPPPLFDVAPHSAEAEEAAMTYALFHWGFTAWSAYIVLGLPIAYFVHERGAPLRVSAILTPFLGVEGLSSPVAKAVDVLAIFATIGGIATSVALVSRQFLTGVEYQWGVTSEFWGPLLFVGGLTGIFVLSAQSGVHRGIRRIAGVNIVLFVVLGLLVFATGPNDAIIATGGNGATGYALEFVPMSLQTGSGWVADWTIWNWAWWLSWAPFAGLFLAALSRGRKIRTVVFTGVVATGLATIAWFMIMGGTALHFQQTGVVDILASIDAYGGEEAVAGFPLLDALPLGELLIFMFLALIIVFMTTSADTSTLIVSILASKADHAPTTAVIVFWGLFQGIVATVVILTGSGELLQAAAVLTGGPFAIIAIVAIVGLILGFRDHEEEHRSLPAKLWSMLPEQPR